MNKNGQALVTFILLIPVFLMVFAFVIDTGLAYSKKNEIISIVDDALKNNYDITEMLKNNKIKYNNLKITENNNQKCVIIESSVDSVFGNIIGIKEYVIKINECRG